MTAYLSPAMRVPSINVRERIPQEAIDDVVNQIATQFEPKQIIWVQLLLSPEEVCQRIRSGLADIW